MSESKQVEKIRQLGRRVEDFLGFAGEAKARAEARRRERVERMIRKRASGTVEFLSGAKK